MDTLTLPKQKRVIVEFQTNYGKYIGPHQLGENGPMVPGDRAVFTEAQAEWLCSNPADSPRKICKKIGACENDDTGVMDTILGGENFAASIAKNLDRLAALMAQTQPAAAAAASAPHKK